ncbi:Carboxylesterase protein [Dioscorea alata]|uniref:Carboxylesterase protein n=1 Tax=Dioscorea alata TaxID=55571 RepID=A0ACB7VLY1_DIOAL|nr:Carboxylesterase protein [Dioscorea alata]
MAGDETAPQVIDDCRGVLRVFNDGSIWRSPNPSYTTAVYDDGSIEWKDLPFGSPDLGLHLRLYRPSNPSSPSPLPIFFYFHGGGFCIGSRTWPNCQNYCFRLARDLSAIIIAPDYRLSPEHPLPAAIHDGFASLDWLRSQASEANPDPWLSPSSADFSRIFISGDSAGGTITHHLSLHFSFSDPSPILIRGFILLMPFFGGEIHTSSEVNCPPDASLNLELNDRYWRLSLPRGATRDDPISNPFGPGGPDLESVRFESMMVVIGGKDLLRDRAVEYARRLKELGKPVQLVEFVDQQHGFFTLDPWSQPSDQLMASIKRFMHDNHSV